MAPAVRVGPPCPCLEQSSNVHAYILLACCRMTPNVLSSKACRTWHPVYHLLLCQRHVVCPLWSSGEHAREAVTHVPTARLRKRHCPQCNEAVSLATQGFHATCASASTQGTPMHDSCLHALPLRRARVPRHPVRDCGGTDAPRLHCVRWDPTARVPPQ